MAFGIPESSADLRSCPTNPSVDGELVALDEFGRPSFNILQNYGSAPPAVIYYVFDVMVLAGKDVTQEPFAARQDLLERKVLPALAEPVRYAGDLVGTVRDLTHAVKARRLEGLVAKRRG